MFSIINFIICSSYYHLAITMDRPTDIVFFYKGIFAKRFLSQSLLSDSTSTYGKNKSICELSLI